ncbi:MAG TPA: DUF3858 domain-containing protein, partial [Chitinophagaceae bacterium]|nr:DUF3858 domain-containing protein [Chitinophagaceae bacterium]
NNYFLDATQPYLGFGKLASYCYNGHARAVFKQTVPLYFMPDALLETKVNNIILYNDSITAGKWNGNISSNLGYNESSYIRNKIVSKGKGVFEKELKSTFTNNYFIQNIDLEDVDSCEKSMKIKYNVTIGDKQEGNVIYFNPMIIESYKENPFKSAIRKYPVEMPYKIDETTTLYIEIPNGYEVDEIPKSAKATLNEADGYFEYLISKDTDHINFRTRIKLEKAFFMPNEYENLRTFFNYIVKKQSEQIVFKKKK